MVEVKTTELDLFIKSLLDLLSSFIGVVSYFEAKKLVFFFELFVCLQDKQIPHVMLFALLQSQINQ